ncbi:MAG: hypothetical protein ACX939_06790 [Hyphococcus sp.]
MGHPDRAGAASACRDKSSNVLIKEDGVWRAVAARVSGYERANDD